MVLRQGSSQAVLGIFIGLGLALAIATGMRRGELLALKWQDINFSTSTLQIRRILTRFPDKGYVEAEPKTQKSNIHWPARPQLAAIAPCLCPTTGATTDAPPQSLAYAHMRCGLTTRRGH